MIFVFKTSVKTKMQKALDVIDPNGANVTHKFNILCLATIAAQPNRTKLFAKTQNITVADLLP